MLRVLVIDDEPVILKATKRLLRAHEVVTAEGGAEALAHLDAGETFDVILCDMTMPRMSGAELYAVLRSRHPDHARRTIFVTGGAITPETDAFLAHVDCPRLDKPFGAAALAELLGRVVEKGAQ